MKNVVFIFLVVLIASCASRRIVPQVPTVKEVDKKLLKYTFISSEIEHDSLHIKLQYGGGCVRPHLFQLVRTNSEKPGEVNIFLLHTTLDDKCKALIRFEQKFGISSLLNDKSITSLKLNGEKELLPQEESTQ